MSRRDILYASEVIASERPRGDLLKVSTRYQRRIRKRKRKNAPQLPSVARGLLRRLVKRHRGGEDEDSMGESISGDHRESLKTCYGILSEFRLTDPVRGFFFPAFRYASTISRERYFGREPNNRDRRFSSAPAKA